MEGGGVLLSKTFLFYGATLSFIFGVMLASIDGFIVHLDEAWVFGFILACIVIFFFFEFNKYIKIALFVAIFLFLGTWRFLLTVPDIDINDLAIHNGKSLEISGVIDSDVVRKDNKQNFVMKTASGKAMIFARAYPEYFYGDRLKIFCDLKTPEMFNDFDYGRYLAKDGIYSICYYPRIQKIGEKQGNFFMMKIYALRHRFADIIDRGLSEPESGVARATILGEGKIIDDELRQSFSYSGLSHIIAISGMHITVMAAIMYFVLFKIGLSRNQVFYLSLCLLFVFIIMAGAPSSAVRSGVMAALAMFAIKIGRNCNFGTGRDLTGYQ